MNIIYVFMICRKNSIGNFIYMFIGVAESGKRNSVLHGAVYKVSPELVQNNAARLFQVWAYKIVCPREQEEAPGEPAHQCRSSSSLTTNKEHGAS
jgi:hypothetical protein